jgi:hypothetical protein
MLSATMFRSMKVEGDAIRIEIRAQADGGPESPPRGVG